MKGAIKNPGTGPRAGKKAPEIRRGIPALGKVRLIRVSKYAKAKQAPQK